MSYDYSSHNHYMNTNVIDHRPSLLLSTRQLTNRSLSPTFTPSQKIPTTAIYRSLTRNSPQFNVEELIDKYQALDIETENSSKKISVNEPNAVTFKHKTGATPKTVTKTTPSFYRRKNCEGCSYKMHDFGLKYLPDEACKRLNGKSSSNQSETSGRSYSSSNSSYDRSQNNSSWRFKRQNSVASSYYSTEPQSTTSLVSSVSCLNSERSPRSVTATSIQSDSFKSLGTVRKSKVPKRQTQNHTPAKHKPVHMKNVFVVNGSVISFHGHGFESFTNWFGDESMLSSEMENKSRNELHREFDMSGFTNQEINMKLYDGNKLTIEASRPMRGRYPAMRFKETIQLPKNLNVESLIVCRKRSGSLVVQDVPRLYSFTKPRVYTP